MNIAYLDPPYSRYFHRLAARLAKRTGGDVVAMLSSPAYRIYTRGDRSLVWEPGRADPAPLPPGTHHATWSQTEDAEFRSLFWHAVEWFRTRFREEGIALCFLFSDARPFSLAATLAARELGISCLYFERGAFRYCTASISTLGLNARFSLRRARELHEVKGLPAEEHLHRRPLERGLKRHFVRFIMSNAVACLRHPQRRRLQHKRYALAPYLRLSMVQWWTEHHVGLQDDARLQLGPSTPVVLVPMQLPGDSQMVLHSPFESNQAFLDFVVQRARQAVPGVRVLVKRHPMDSTHYRMPEGAAAIGGNLSRFFVHDPVVVCINSTVGFEAAARGVQVVCFGDSFYTDPAFVTRATPEDFPSQLAAAMERGRDPAAGHALKEAVLRWYQVPGDVWAFTKEDLDRTAEIILQHHHARQGLARRG
jgi:capsular polysaccharide export protein